MEVSPSEYVVDGDLFIGGQKVPHMKDPVGLQGVLADILYGRRNNVVLTGCNFRGDGEVGNDPVDPGVDGYLLGCGKRLTVPVHARVSDTVNTPDSRSV